MGKPIAVHIGAGNIGRGFVGEQLYRAGYALYFLDVNEEMIQALQTEKEYNVYYAQEPLEQFQVQIVGAYHTPTQTQEAIALLAKADLITISVGVSILDKVAPLVSQGLQQRASDAPCVHVIACENAVNASDTLRGFIDPNILNRVKVGFLNAAVDRIVPLQTQKNKLDVLVEPYFEWVIETKHIVGEHHPITGAHYVDEIGAYIERKLFTVNTGHAAASYIGARCGYTTIQSAMQEITVQTILKETLQETGRYLTQAYGFSDVEQAAYIEKTIARFANPCIVDDIERVARGCLRKLSPQDRLIKPMRGYYDTMKEVPHALCQVVADAFLYDNPADADSAALQATIQEKGIEQAIVQITGLPVGSALCQEIQHRYCKTKEQVK